MTDSLTRAEYAAAQRLGTPGDRWPQNRGLAERDWVNRISFGAQLITDEARAGEKPIASGPGIERRSGRDRRAA